MYSLCSLVSSFSILLDLDWFWSFQMDLDLVFGFSFGLDFIIWFFSDLVFGGLSVGSGLLVFLRFGWFFFGLDSLPFLIQIC